MNNNRRRLEIAQYYLNNDTSFRQTALKFRVAYCTVFKWVKLYKEQGEKRLLASYKRPWNRIRSAAEEKIVLMKEHDPGLTVRQVKKEIEKEGIKISIKGIWGIWKRFGYAGFNQKNMTGSFTDCPWTKEAQKKYAQGKWLFNRGQVAASSEILNSIPALPENDLLPRIPDALLRTRRQIEKTNLLFGKMPVRAYLRQLRSLYDDCHRQGLFYSSLIVGSLEIKALSWSGEPLKMLNRVAELKEILKRTGRHYSYSLFALRLSLLISEGFAHTGLLTIKKASDIARTCRAMLKRHKHISPFFMRDLGQLCSQLEDFTEAKYWYLKAIGAFKNKEAKITRSLLADTFIVNGEYEKAIEMVKNEELDYWGSQSKIRRIQSMWALAKGMPDQAISLATEVLASLEKEKAKGSMFGCYFTIASAYCSLGERNRARRMLKKILPFLIKNKLGVVRSIIDIFFSQAPVPIPAGSAQLREQTLPTIRLALLLKSGQYAAALKYAEKKGIMAFLHRYIFFYPEAVRNMLEKDRPVSLPRAMLNLPLFRKEIPVYLVKFLGNLIIYKNQKYLKIDTARKRIRILRSGRSGSAAEIFQTRPPGRARLTPKDTAFLIHLATAKSRHIALDSICRNFWQHSERSSRNLAHLLVRIRKALRLPSQFLYIKGNRLHIDCHFITDYGDHQEHLAQAKAFSAAGEWSYSTAEYLKAFSLFRSAPFNKMYDNWSEEMRNTILGNLENEAENFAKVCSAHGDPEKGAAVLKRISRVIPYSDGG